jgi:transaldolase
MALYLDSGLRSDAEVAAQLGFVRGITTNPTLLARAGWSAEDAIPALCHIFGGQIFHQVRAEDSVGIITEGRAFYRMAPKHVVLKIPCTLAGLRALAILTREDIPCAVTAIFSPAQVVLACEAGAQYIIPYVNRSTRLLGDGLALVREMAAVCRTIGRGTEILAASIKSPDEAVGALLAGAHHISVPLMVLQTMAESPYSHQAIREFATADAGVDKPSQGL